MPTTTNINAIYLGEFDPVDTNQSNGTAEFENDLLGTYTSLTFVDITEHDQDDDGVISDDDTMGGRSFEDRDYFEYDVGFGVEDYEIDVTMQATIRVTLGDGSTIDVSAVVLQTTIGDVFIRDFSDSLDNLNIQSIEILTFTNDNFAGFVTGKTITNSAIVCFLSGSQIETTRGPVAVEKLVEGMEVLTADHGPQPIVWIARSNSLNQRAIVISPGALGAGLPRRALCLSAQHKVLLRSRIIRRMCANCEILLPVKRLTSAPGICAEPVPPDTDYWHILLPRHAIVFAEGAPVESFYPGPQSIKALHLRQKSQLRNCLATLGMPSATGYDLIRPVPRGHIQRTMVRRHVQNQVPFLDAQAANLADAGSAIANQPLTIV